jgi:ppGpp synthetase/RelA/SpoT-type nucleotidyltranferase
MTNAEKDKTSFDFEAHRNIYTEEYRRRRNLYEEFSRAVNEILADAINTRGLRASDIQFRAKTIESFGKKAMRPSEENPDEPKYPKPLADITDLAGVRVITFFPRTVEEVCLCIVEEFEVLERVDHTASALQEDRLGYQSVHLLVRLANNRKTLSEYRRFDSLVAEVQVRTIMQHAWAEIEHDIRYKSTAAIPKVISRRFMTLAGLLEIADREFQAIQEEDKAIRANARTLIEENRLKEVEITPDALQLYLNLRLGADDRISEDTYEWQVRLLRRMGFQNLGQIEECTSGHNDDKLSRLALGSRQGQISRFEVLLVVGMGENYRHSHPWNQNAWFHSMIDRWLDRLRKGGITVGSYLPTKGEE